MPDTPPLYEYLTGRQYIALVASNLTPDGAVYTTIATFDVVQGV